jgi:hypothetical protein
MTRSRIAYPAVQVVREARSPLRGRFAAARRGQDLTNLRVRGRAPVVRHPLRAAARLIGAADPTGPIWAVTMVRNEEVRIGGAVRRLVAGGVDVVVVADNLSTDGTRDVLADLARELSVIVVDDREPAYYQGAKMSRLSRAAARHGASWIVPFDADELWYGMGGTISERLRGLRGDAAPAQVFDFLPGADVAGADPYVAFTRRTRAPVTRKTAFRAHLLASVATGNHWVAQPVRQVRDALVIRHYPYLDFDHFVRKARDGVAALGLTDHSSGIAGHWRRWAALDGQDLAEAWREVVGGDLVDDPLPPGSFG